MDTSKLKWGEMFAAVGGLVLGVSIFIQKTYEARPENVHAQIAGLKGTVSIWQVHDIMRWLLLAAAGAPLILSWIIMRGHALSWPRGEMTAVVAVAALGLIGYVAFVDKPGTVTSLVSLRLGVFVSFLGALLMLFGSALRASSVERPRKPPGVI